LTFAYSYGSHITLISVRAAIITDDNNYDDGTTMGFSTTFSGTMDLTGLGNTLEKALIFAG